ncbi:hypothetical protein AN958_00894 [Leucoagaricus sp. SymC.cos]|nr:hypothetical protein AN958_00894 [Leucoagaricus sp. SymC.cos]
MSSGPTEASSRGVVRDVHIFSQNINHNYAHVDYVLENLNILYIQEPPWRTIKQIVSMTSLEGNDVVGAPKHPDWLYMNIFVLSLFTLKRAVNFLNIYSDDAHTAINLLSQKDPAHASYPLIAQCLLEFASDVRLEWACPSNPELMHILHNPDLAGSMINLIFMGPLSVQSNLPRLDLDCCGPLDHVPISTLVPIFKSEIRVSHMVIPRESLEESGFLVDLTTGLWALNVKDLLSPD